MFNLGSKNLQRIPPNKSSIGISPDCREFVGKLSRRFHRIHGTGIFYLHLPLKINDSCRLICHTLDPIWDMYVCIYIYIYLWITKKVEGRSKLGPFFAFCCQVFTSLNGPFAPIHSQVGCTGLHWTKNHPNKLMFF